MWARTRAAGRTAESPRKPERKGLVHETVGGKALTRALETADCLGMRRNRLLTSNVSSRTSLRSVVLG